MRPLAAGVPLVLFLTGATTFIALALAAHRVAYFSIDLPLAQAIQSLHSTWLDSAMSAVSWIVYAPQGDVLVIALAGAIVLAGYRWAALMLVLAAAGSSGLYQLASAFVAQPRPAADLVRVTTVLPTSGFPSGHVTTVTAIFGFAAFLAYRALRPSPTKWIPVAVVALTILVMGYSRVYLGAHWPSEVLGGGLLGLQWLAATVRLFWWGRRHLPPQWLVSHHVIVRPAVAGP